MSKRDSRLDELYQLKYDVVVDLYRQRTRILAAKSKGLEAFLYKAFGSDLIPSLALLLNPKWQFDSIPTGKKGVPKSLLFSTLFPAVPVPVNRVREALSIFPFWPKYHETNHHIGGHDFWWFDGSKWNYSAINPIDTVTYHVGHMTTFGQQPVMKWIKDTTWKSRNPGVKITRRQNKLGLNSQGEFERFEPYFVRSGCTYGGDTLNQKTKQFQTGFGWGTTISDDRFSGYWDDLCSVTNPGSISSWPNTESVYAQGVMAKNLDTMLARCVPTRRYYNLFYQVGELKDLPLLLRTSLTNWRDIERLLGAAEFKLAWTKPSWWTEARVTQLSSLLRRVGITRPHDKSLADLYLNFKFGWQSIYQACDSLVRKPSHITKEVNYLISRNGRFTNLSFSRKWEEQVAAFPALIVPVSTANLQTGAAMSQSARRKVELRCVCNVGVHFPTLNVPALRKDLFLEKLGVYPSPGDLYDLIPFTWMVDWYSGLGDYIHLMDSINGDRSLINYGFMSYKSYTTVTAHWELEYPWKTVMTLIPGGQTIEQGTNFVRPSSSLVLEYELRKSLQSLAGVKTYSGTGLSLYQGSILGALLSKFI